MFNRRNVKLLLTPPILTSLDQRVVFGKASGALQLAGGLRFVGGKDDDYVAVVANLKMAEKTGRQANQSCF